MKTVLDVLIAAGVAGKALVATLIKFGQEHPDAQPEVDRIVGQLNAAINPAALAGLGKTILDELAALPTKGLDPRDHPSDLV